MIIPPICPYCGRPAELVDGRKVYPHRKDLYRLKFWLCSIGHEPAYVGCHKGGDGCRPLGRLADAELRAAKSRAHRAFDPLWRDGLFRSRAKAYLWLSHVLGIPASETHIGMMDVETCDRVEEISTNYAIDDLFDRSEWPVNGEG